MRLLPPVDVSVFSKDFSADVRAALQKRMEAWIEPYADERNTVKLDMLYAYKSAGHFGSYRSAAAAFLDAQLPFYLKPIFVAATSSNFRFRNNHRLARHMITMLDPAIAAVETATGGPAEQWRPTNTHRFVPYYGRIGRKAVNKVAQKALGRTLRGLTGRRTPRLSQTRRAALDHLKTYGGLRYEDLRLAPLLSRPGFEELMRQARNAEPRDPSLLGRIITAELALRATDGALGR
jgi:hypothetical protein